PGHRVAVVALPGLDGDPVRGRGERGPGPAAVAPQPGPAAPPRPRRAGPGGPDQTGGAAPRPAGRGQLRRRHPGRPGRGRPGWPGRPGTRAPPHGAPTRRVAGTLTPWYWGPNREGSRPLQAACAAVHRPARSAGPLWLSRPRRLSRPL